MASNTYKMQQLIAQGGSGKDAWRNPLKYTDMLRINEF